MPNDIAAQPHRSTVKLGDCIFWIKGYIHCVDGELFERAGVTMENKLLFCLFINVIWLQFSLRDMLPSLREAILLKLTLALPPKNEFVTPRGATGMRTSSREESDGDGCDKPWISSGPPPLSWGQWHVECSLVYANGSSEAP